MLTIDYQQTKDKRLEKNIPTGKIHGLRKFDYVDTEKGKGFVKGMISIVDGSKC